MVKVGEMRVATAVPPPNTTGIMHYPIGWEGGPHDRFQWMLNELERVITSTTVVAVVGSSGNVLSRGYGNLIDQANVIVRVNAAGTKGFEDDVGSSTHIRVGWKHGMRDAVNRHVITPGEILILTTSNNRDGQPQWAHKSFEELGAKHARLCINEEWAGQLHTSFLHSKGGWASTGFVALAVVLQRFTVHACP